jgi:hypothetical protein
MDFAGAVTARTPTKDDFIFSAKVCWELMEGGHGEDDVVFDRLRVFSSEVARWVSDPALYRESPPSKYNSGEISKERNESADAYSAQMHSHLVAVTSAKEAAKLFEMAVWAKNMLRDADGQLTSIGLARWCDNGFPQITMGHKFCAALMATTMSEEAANVVRAPWNAFIIEVPGDLLFLHDVDGTAVSVKRLLVVRHNNRHAGDNGWGYVAFTDTTLTIWRYGMTPAMLSKPEIEGGYLSPHSLELTDRDNRLACVIGRLIVNTCLAMSDPRSIKKVGPGHKVYEDRLSRRMDPEPVTRTFQVGAPIKLDCRAAVHDFVEGHASRVQSVQVLVCGHYRTQHHGPKNSLTKVIWILPFWRGPEDAPILVRPHELQKEER